MKKVVENYTIDLNFIILYQQKKYPPKIKLSFTIHSLLKQVQLELAKHLKQNPFKFQCLFKHKNNPIPLKECSSLL